MKTALEIVWFKRDLRVFDHQPLYVAAQHGKVLPLYIFESGYWRLPDTSKRHFEFISDCVKDLYHYLQKLGQGLCIECGDVVEVLNRLQQQYHITAIRSHEETGNAWTYERDKQVKKWCQQQQIPWVEYRQFAVIRGLQQRKGWAQHWHELMDAPLMPAISTLSFIQKTQLTLPSAQDLQIEDDGLQQRQQGSRRIAVQRLKQFLQRDSRYYQRNLSSPLTAWQGCSRLSVYLSYGCLSMREIYYATLMRIETLKAEGDNKYWLRSLSAYISRLHWHCHFIQKLETQPEIEYQNLLPATNGLRDNDFREDFYVAWKTGQTGYPFVDACMRCLLATGWMNFRMRAMLVSFAGYELWLHWHKPALHLARCFVDYEPGIHYSQIQMQSGTTGINTVRVYNPVKQGKEQDPKGIFIRRWCPELASLSNEEIHEPWLHEHQLSYPAPIVDRDITVKWAKDKIYALKKSPQAKAQKQLILDRHVDQDA